MSNTDSESGVHWLIEMAQDIRINETPLPTSGQSAIDADLAHSSLPVLGELIDRCGFDIEHAFLQGYAYGLNQAGLIDDVVLRAINGHVGATEDNVPASGIEHQH
jgi:hypothetical protein